MPLRQAGLDAIRCASRPAPLPRSIRHCHSSGRCLGRAGRVIIINCAGAQVNQVQHNAIAGSNNIQAIIRSTTLHIMQRYRFQSPGTAGFQRRIGRVQAGRRNTAFPAVRSLIRRRAITAAHTGLRQPSRQFAYGSLARHSNGQRSLSVPHHSSHSPGYGNNAG